MCMYLAHDPSKVKSYGYISFKYIHERKLVAVVNIYIFSKEGQSHCIIFSITNKIYFDKSNSVRDMGRDDRHDRKKFHCHKNWTMIFIAEIK